MIILKMRASFGKLNGELTLHEGMNLLCLPNEAGKSTWSAFLLAMLYGIDTSEKPSAANQRLPMKERYKPWDGRPMEGAIDLLWQGRRITIERQTHGRVPMGIFRAYETDGATPIAELTADNCGVVLCGVERSVFERTAFIRQLGLSVTEDRALEKRLGALVTTGEEGKTASELEKELHDMKVKLSRPSTGRISRLNDQLEQTKRTLSELYTMQDEAMRIRAEIDETQAQLDRQNALVARIEQAKNAKKYLALEELRQKNAAQEALCRRLQAQIAVLPDEAALHTLQRQLDQAGNRLHTAQMEAAFATNAPQKPRPPQCFIGMDPAAAGKKAEADIQEYQRLTDMNAPKSLPLLLCAALCVAGIALCFVMLYLGLSIIALGLISFTVALLYSLRQSKKLQEARHKAALILGRYGMDDISQIPLLVSDYTAQMEQYETENAAYEAEKQACAQRLTAAQSEVEEIIQQVKAFAPDCSDAAQCREAISSALNVRAQHLSEQRSLELQRTQLSSMQQLLGQEVAQPVDTEALGLDEPKLLYERNAAVERLSQLHAKLAQHQGKLSATGDAPVLESTLENLRAELSAAQERSEVIDIAATALHRADEQLRSRFSPQITAEAGALLAELTDGKYPRLLLQPDMSLSVREEGGLITHPAAAMSCGTADQMYLALRLAMCRRLLPENAPLLLDDALVNFDDARTASALKLLANEAKNRQIILFTCKEISNVL